MQREGAGRREQGGGPWVGGMAGCLAGWEIGEYKDKAGFWEPLLSQPNEKQDFQRGEGRRCEVEPCRISKVSGRVRERMF